MWFALAWADVAGEQMPVVYDDPNTEGDPESVSISARNTMLAPAETVG